MLQMVDATPQTVVIQMQASAADGANAWDMRCDLREGLIRCLRDQHPQWLSRRPRPVPALPGGSGVATRARMNESAHTGD
ncbi:hypothetical protein AB0C04_24235 [Micromonospora sp. NPDC048909]|uniref:hypothetical protein n=1 Tax=Micromonospora sp. NPDC048909 TaxID=3155643 RepID=UPI0033F3BC45